MKKLLFVLAALVPAISQAAYYVSCGENYREDLGDFERVVAVVSSGDNKFSGKPDDHWSYKVEGSDWNPNLNATIKRDHDEDTLTLNVGVDVYLIENAFYEDKPTLKFTPAAGAFQTFECRVTED